MSTDAANVFASARVGFLSPDSTFEASVATCFEVFSFLPIVRCTSVLDDGQGTCECRHGYYTLAVDRRGLTGGSALTLDLPRPKVLRRHTYGGIVASLFQTTDGGLLRVSIPDGAVSKAPAGEPSRSPKNSGRTASVQQQRQPFCVTLLKHPLRDKSTAIWDKTLAGTVLYRYPFISPHDITTIEIGGGMADQTNGANGTDAKAPVQPKQRSPEHPAIDLKEALKRADEFYKEEGFNYAPADVAKKHWGYGAKSSSGMRLLAALIHYGLLEEDGAGFARRVRLTQLARAILLDRREDTTERDAALRKAALNPAIFATLWKAWGPSLPSDTSMEFDLIQRYKFNPDSVRAFIKEFKATIAFAKLVQSVDAEDAISEETTTEKEPVGGGGFSPPPPPRNPPPRGDPMPVIQHDASALPPLDVTIPLAGGRRAVLRMPVSISKAEYDLILNVIQINLAALQPTIVATPPEPAVKDDQL